MYAGCLFCHLEHKLELSGKKERQLRKYLHQIACRKVSREFSWLVTEWDSPAHEVSAIHSWADGSGLYKI